MNPQHIKKPDQDIYVLREFLNLHEFNSTASIFWKVIVSDKRVTGTLEIRDCERKITLPIEATNTEEYGNTIHKLTTIINGCQKLIETINSTDKFKHRKDNATTKDVMETDLIPLLGFLDGDIITCYSPEKDKIHNALIWYSQKRSTSFVFSDGEFISLKEEDNDKKPSDFTHFLFMSKGKNEL